MRKAILWMASAGSSVVAAGCVWVMVRILIDLQRSSNNLNELQFAASALGFAAAAWGVFGFGRYAFECFERAGQQPSS